MSLGENISSESYYVDKIYQSMSVDIGTLAKTTSGDIEEIEIIFVEKSLDPGTYSITITREGDDFYRIDGTDIYIKTRYCYEYYYSQDAILKISSYKGHNFGELIILE